MPAAMCKNCDWWYKSDKPQSSATLNANHTALFPECPKMELGEKPVPKVEQLYNVTVFIKTGDSYECLTLDNATLDEADDVSLGLTVGDKRIIFPWHSIVWYEYEKISDNGDCAPDGDAL